MSNDEDTLKAMAVDDDGASLAVQFENAMMDSIQEDKELATVYVSKTLGKSLVLEFFGPRGQRGKERTWKGLQRSPGQKSPSSGFVNGNWETRHFPSCHAHFLL